MSLYHGYTTLNNSFQSVSLSDEDLIKRDILNHFAIRKGEKLFNTDFGSSIYEYIMDPLTEETKDAILQEVQTTIDYDPRVIAQDIIVSEFDNGIQVEVDLVFVTTDASERLLITFLRDNNL